MEEEVDENFGGDMERLLGWSGTWGKRATCRLGWGSGTIAM